MKKFSAFLFAILLQAGTSFSQPCLTEGIVFTNQEQIDNFKSDYPGCTEIGGNVMINGHTITNLDSLENIKVIDGYLEIYNNPNLTDISGLGNLTAVRYFLGIDYNPRLKSLSGLNNLTIIESGLYIMHNDSLTDLSGLENLSVTGSNIRIEYNNLLTTLSALSNLSYTTRGTLSIKSNPLLTDLTGLENIKEVEFCLVIENNASLTSLHGLDNLQFIRRCLMIDNNPVLSDLNALSNLTYIDGELIISQNDALTSLNGLNNLTPGSIDFSMYIIDNPHLSECSIDAVCDYLTTPFAHIYIANNATGCRDEYEVSTACGNNKVAARTIPEENDIRAIELQESYKPNKPEFFSTGILQSDEDIRSKIMKNKTVSKETYSETILK